MEIILKRSHFKNEGSFNKILRDLCVENEKNVKIIYVYAEGICVDDKPFESYQDRLNTRHRVLGF